MVEKGENGKERRLSIKPGEKIQFEPIGVIRSPFKGTEDMPIQPAGAKDIRGQVVLDEAYAVGLSDLDGFSHIFLIYCFHLSKGYELRVRPFMDKALRGLFSTRAPRRPNPIGLSVVRLLGVEGNILDIQGVDVVDGTPLLDVKPYVPLFDAPEVSSIGWLEGQAGKSETLRSDSRFRPHPDADVDE